MWTENDRNAAFRFKLGEKTVTVKLRSGKALRAMMHHATRRIGRQGKNAANGKNKTHSVAVTFPHE